jgi:hypothetical protein
MNTCDTCQHWQPSRLVNSWARGENRFSDSKTCNAPQIDKTCHISVERDRPPDGCNVIVEYDEEWGILTGPKFGCVLWEAK